MSDSGTGKIVLWFGEFPTEPFGPIVQATGVVLLLGCTCPFWFPPTLRVLKRAYTMFDGGVRVDERLCCWLGVSVSVYEMVRSMLSVLRSLTSAKQGGNTTNTYGCYCPLAVQLILAAVRLRLSRRQLRVPGCLCTTATLAL